MNASILNTSGDFTFLDLQNALKARKHFCFIRAWKIKWLIDVFLLKKRIVRQVRKCELFPTDKLVELFLKLVGYANYKKINLQSTITKAYPNFCIYCGQKPCKCTKPGVTRPLFRKIEGLEDPRLTFKAFQKRDWEVYPNDRSYEAKLIRACHLSEEADEFLVEFLLEFIKTANLEKVSEEITDFLERMVSLTNTLKINLAKEIATHVNSLT